MSMKKLETRARVTAKLNEHYPLTTVDRVAQYDQFVEVIFARGQQRTPFTKKIEFDRERLRRDIIEAMKWAETTKPE